ncbi:ROK family protein, partial [Mesorhizobium sp. M7A.F.Ca.US.006.01.1.1]|uniref:ROK family protein n=1 Tax=Mesorhizobium sp. M7A.F.Ca.US.006.01.1.1 TaxID=2496707 RepID=UPI000FCC0DE3
MTTEAALAIDLGGTELRAALVDREGKILAFAAVPTQAQAGPDAVIGQIEALAATVHAEAPALSIVGVGVGAPGPLDPLAGIAVGPPTLAGWLDVP